MGVGSAEEESCFDAEILDTATLRSEIDAFAKEHEGLLSRLNSIKFDFDYAKFATRKQESRSSMLEAENARLKEELVSNLDSVVRNLSKAVTHFNAHEDLNSLRQTHSQLKASQAEKVDELSALRTAIEKRDEENTKLKEDLCVLEEESNSRLQEVQKLHRLETEKWKEKVQEITEAYNCLQDQARKAHFDRQSLASDGRSQARSSEVLWKQKLLTLRGDIKQLQDENVNLKQQIHHLETFRPRAKSSQKRGRIAS
mmetsp:Transcript_9035/g.23204  ORF Transcript_9035/g.23204 Transcript_9035/m.23204 type:complete len:256 (-) Transcript_9035:279-1046(-)